MEELITYINEKDYQQIKKKMCKTNNYFTEKELKKMVQFWCNLYEK